MGLLKTYVAEIDGVEEIQGNVAHDVVDSGNPVKIGGKASTSEPSAVVDGDRVNIYVDEHGYMHIKGANYDNSSDSNKVVNIADLDTKYVDDSLVDTTDISAATHYYPSSSGVSIDGFKDLSLSGKLLDADGTLTLSVEVTNDEDTATADWVKVYGYDDKNNVTVNSLTVTNGTITLAVSFNNINYKYYRVVVVASGATNTVIIKQRRKAL